MDWQKADISRCGVFVLQGDTIQFDAMLNDFNILVYVDSAGCTECRMRMPAWNAFMTRLNSGDSRIGLIFLVNGVDVRTVSEMAEKHGFTYPILAYKKCQYAFPENRKYQTFLLGSSNTVLALGDPIENESIAKLYYRIIGEEVGSIPEDSNITVSASRISLGVVRPEEEKSAGLWLQTTQIQLSSLPRSKHHARAPQHTLPLIPFFHIDQLS